MEERIREAGFQEVGRDGEARMVGIGRFPEILEPKRKALCSDEIEEDTLGIVPDVGEPEGEVFWREGNHKIVEK